MREHLTKNVDAKAVFGEWKIWHRYTYGIAGEKFFREIKEKGQLVASQCPDCRKAFLPPNLYCEDCFVEITNYHPVEGYGIVDSFTVLHQSLDETSLAEPIIIAFVRFEGIVGGWIAPLVGIEPKQLSIGMKVKLVFNPKDQRKGKINDIAYFTPV